MANDFIYLYKYISTLQYFNIHSSIYEETDLLKIYTRNMFNN